MEARKQCRICQQVLPFGEFHRARGMRDGRRNECKHCFREISRARYAEDPERVVRRVQVWREANPERFAEYQAEYRSRPERKRAMRDLYYRRTYGISADAADALLVAQGGKCGICGRAPERLASFHLDHDHATGAIRGFLCIDCNQGLGKLQDDPELLRRAADYVESHRAS